MATDVTKGDTMLMNLLHNTQRRLPLFSVAASLLLTLTACFQQRSNDVTEIVLRPAGENALKVMVAVQCTDTTDAAVVYWPKGQAAKKSQTPLSNHQLRHEIIMTGLAPATAYEYRILTGHGTRLRESKIYDFTTNSMPIWLKDIFQVICPDSSILPAEFKKGYVMLTKRDDPGMVCMVNAKGEIVWYHQVQGTGYKVARFTKNHTVLGLLGGPGYETSYGDQILEVSLTGDTLLNLKKGQNDFKQTIHHEILENEAGQLITLCVEEKVMDLRRIGGSVSDTVKGDGILVLDRNGRQVWKWTAFDAIDPLQDKNILKDKHDWMHANCIAIDQDGNYMISFYNNGQIWKIDAHSGKHIWTFGKNGDFQIPDTAYFDQAHAVHINHQGNLMFFDNGVSKKTSRTLVFRLDENKRTAVSVTDTKLPPEYYNERMGSSFSIGDHSLLVCATKRNTVVLTNLEGRFQWLLKTGMSSYRASFIPAASVAPYINRPGYEH
ncbi:arylsulfotransferase ASST [Chitinophaga dinghuensis]|uniref:Arylsulfotransferase ASST n=1 Tax=Chitinophaga dinghuensis TaxID=1539050 RepID=A0A327VY96_9BACT|nr:aryl-sulfate sulfotransferase [Chitinophaga dinghuensis]RAJ80323.1 arylsulfotransferase ASST [Chitinophaga dinghuensis]